MIKEFKKFIMRGNVIDLAVGIIIGAAFNKIVSSMVEDVITPIISWITGATSIEGFNLADLVIVLNKAAEGSGAADTSIKIGSFITYIIDFLINGFVIFIIIKLINKVKPAEKPPEVFKCPSCKMAISEEATRCPHCTSELIKEENDD